MYLDQEHAIVMYRRLQNWLDMESIEYSSTIDFTSSRKYQYTLIIITDNSDGPFNDKFD